MDLATKATRVVTTGKSVRYRSPTWTPDGKYIVVARAAGAIGPSKLWMYDKDGGSGIQLIRDPTPLNGAIPVSTIGPAFEKDDRSSGTHSGRRMGVRSQDFRSTSSRRSTDAPVGERRGPTCGSAFRPALSRDGSIWSRFAPRVADRSAYSRSRNGRREMARLSGAARRAGVVRLVARRVSGIRVHPGLEGDRRFLWWKDLERSSERFGRDQHSVPRPDKIQIGPSSHLHTRSLIRRSSRSIRFATRSQPG